MAFHPVILAGGRGSRMYPLTEECPKALLPVANRPLIWYPVQMLEKNGFEEALVVVRESFSQAVSDVLEGFRLQHGVRLNLSVVGIPDAEDWGTADSLRHIKHRIKADVLLISCDLVSTVPLHLLTDFHRSHDSTLTALLVSPPPPSEDEPRKKTAINTESDIVGLADDSRLVYYSAQADLDDELTISRATLKRYPHVRMYSRLVDAHLYLLKKWVLDYLMDNKGLQSVKGELVPHLVHSQSLAKSSSTEGMTTTKQAMRTAALSCIDSLEELALTMSSYSGLRGRKDAMTNQLVRCHAVLVQHELCTRVNTVPAFVEVNRMLPRHLGEFQLERTQSPVGAQPFRGKGVSSDSLLGTGVQLSDKASVKHSIIGHHCKVGDKSKIINCIIMDHVYIGEGCSLQGCVVSSQAHIEERVSLKDCQVGANFTVTKEADLKGETLVVDAGIHF